MRNFKFFCSILCIVLWSSSCKKDPIVPNEEELITTMEYNLISKSDASKVVIFTFEDIDGDGGVDPVISSGLLESNTAYSGTLKLKNSVVNPAIDISEEIKTEANDHQFFFDISEGFKSNILINYDDQDDDNKPIGLKTIVQTNNAGEGKLKITLRHKPNKSASGVSTGDITNAGGETDIEVTFDIIVK